MFLILINCTVVILRESLYFVFVFYFLKEYTLKYLGAKEHYVRNLISKGQGEKIVRERGAGGCVYM